MEEDKLNSVLKFFAKGSFILLIGVFISKIITYFYRIIIAKNFGPEGYGLFSLAVMIATLFSSFFSLGLQSGILRYISLFRGKGEDNKIRSLIRFSCLVTLIASIASFLLLFFLSGFISTEIFHNSELIPFLKIFAIFLPVFLFSGLFHVIIIAYEKVGLYSFIGNILCPAVQLIFLFIFIFVGLKETSISLSYNLGLLSTFIASFLIYLFGIKIIHEKYLPKKEDNHILYKELLSYSWPIMFFGLIVSIFSWIDSFTIGYFKTASDVGIYNAASTLATLLEVVPSLFLQLFLPIITKEYSKNNKVLVKDLSKQIAKWIFLLNLPVLAIIIVFPGAVLNILFGSEYIAAENSLRFLSIGLFIYSLLRLSENLLYMIGSSKRILLNLTFASLMNIILNIILIPTYGITGASFSTMLSYIFWGLLSLFIAKKKTGIIPLRKDLLKILIIMTIPLVLLIYFRKLVFLNTINILLMGLAFLIIYFLLIFLTKSLDKNDLMILKSIKNKILIKG
jgi:O-antigen/teichoic acid export membrane protein